MKKKMILRLTGIIIVILVLTFCVIAYLQTTTAVSKQFERSEAKQYALKLAKESMVVQHYIGTEILEDSIENSFKRKGQIKINFGLEGIDMSHDAVDMEIPIKGNKGKAVIILKAFKDNDTWIYDHIDTHIIERDTVIDLKPKGKY